MLHLIDEEIAMQYLPAKKIKRLRLALATKPHDVFFFCIVPSQNLDNPWNATALEACEQAKTSGCRLSSRKAKASRLQDRATPATRTLSRSEMADADARRADRGHVSQRQHRHRQPSRPAPPDRREAGSDVMPQSCCFRTIVVVDFEYEIDDGDLPHVLCMVAYVLDENLRHVAPSGSGAASSARRRRSTSAPTRCSSPTACGPR